MTVRVGWKVAGARPPGQIGGGIWLFELLNIDTKNGRGRRVVVGLLSMRREDLERLVELGVVLDITVIGRMRFADDVPLSLFEKAIGKTRVFGTMRGPAGIRTMPG